MARARRVRQQPVEGRLSQAAVVRLARPEDGPALAEIYRPAVADAAISFELDPPDAAEMARRVTLLTPRLPWLVCEVGDRVIGYAYAGRHRDRAAYQWSVEVSAYVAGAARRAGVARALYTSLFAVLTAQGFHRAYAGVTLPNPGSVALHESMGFAPIGVFHDVGYKGGSWHDVAWFERQLAPRGRDHPLPTPLAALLGTEELRESTASGLAFLRFPAS